MKRREARLQTMLNLERVANNVGDLIDEIRRMAGVLTRISGFLGPSPSERLDEMVGKMAAGAPQDPPGSVRLPVDPKGSARLTQAHPAAQAGLQATAEAEGRDPKMKAIILAPDDHPEAQEALLAATEAEIRYGDEGTIHRTGEVNVERGQDGTVVAVWFRCRTLPFSDSRISEPREATLREAYAEMPPPGLKAVIFEAPGLGPEDGPDEERIGDLKVGGTA